VGEPQLAFARLSGAPGRGPLLVVGPSLGTSVDVLWQATADLLDGFEVVGWDLPGHGRSDPTTEPFTVGELAATVRRTAAALVGEGGRPASYAGVSLGGAVALELAIDPGVFTRVACIASAARIGEPEGWHERAALVRAAGTPVLVSGAAQRWFAPGFVERNPTAANRLLLALSDTDRESYALACEALAAHDLRGRLGEVTVPLLVAPGEHDPVVGVELARETATAAGGRLHVMTGCAHQPPVEDPTGLARVLLEHVEEKTRA
jgi:pimeloyl-ACP methyl ester carboxylesterase